MASTAAPEVAHHFTARFHRLLRGGIVDLAIGDPSAGTSLPITADDAALATWRDFIRSAGVAGAEAEAATNDWLKRRATIRAIKG